MSSTLVKRNSIHSLGAPATESSLALLDRLNLAKQVELLSENVSLSDMPKFAPAEINSEKLVLEDFLPDRICKNLVVDYSPFQKIGQGTGAEVYRARYYAEVDDKLHDYQTEVPVIPENFFVPLGRPLKGDLPLSVARKWLPCAVKRVPKSEDGLLMALNEVYILYLLNHLTPNVITLIGIKEDQKQSADLLSLKSQMEQSSSTSPNSPSMPYVGEHSVLSGGPATTRYPTTLSLSRKRLQKLEEPCYYVVLELAGNGNLWQYLQQNKYNIGKQQFLQWSRQIAESVVVLHSQGIVHHDIKPQNVLLDGKLNGKLCDFSCARFIPSFERSEEGDVCAPSVSIPRTEPLPIPTTDGEALLRRKISTESGTSEELSPGAKSSTTAYGSPTPSVHSLRDGLGRGTQAFSAPEILAIDGEYSTPVDVYSLGVTMYTIISGKEPFDQARSGMEMLLGIKKGFFESGLQSPFYTSTTSHSASYSSSGGNYNYPKFSSSLTSNQPPNSTSSTTAVSITDWVFLNGETVPLELKQLIKSCLAKSPLKRPSAQQVFDQLMSLDPPPTPLKL